MIEILELYWKNNFFIGVVLLETIMCIQFEKKKNSLWKWLLLTLLLFLISSGLLQVWNWEEQRITVSSILINIPGKVILCILSLVQMYVCYEISMWNAFFLLTIAIIVQKAQFNLYKILEIFFIGPVTFTTPGFTSILLAIIVVLFVALILWFMTRKKGGLIVRIDSQNKNVIALSLLIMMINDILNMYLFVTDPYANFGKTLICTRVYDTLFHGVTLYMLYNLISRKTLEMEKMMQQVLERQRMSQYAFAKELFETINIKSHDLRKQMRYLQNERVEQEEFLTDLKDTLDSFDMMVHTSNHALNTILSEKSSMCYQKKIPFSYIATGENMDFMRELDIYTLFANLMDNAIEASEKIDEKKRHIEVVIKTQGDFLSIHMENAFLGKVYYKEGRIMTIKQDRAYHGFGLRSMKQIVEKYEGNISVSTENKLFKVNILIPIPEENKS